MCSVSLSRSAGGLKARVTMPRLKTVFASRVRATSNTCPASIRGTKRLLKLHLHHILHQYPQQRSRFAQIDGDLKQPIGVEPAERLPLRHVVVFEAEPIDGVHTLDEESEPPAPAHFFEAFAANVGCYVVETIDEYYGTTDVVWPDDGLKSEPFGKARCGQADLQKRFLARDVGDRPCVNGRKRIGLYVAVEYKGLRRHRAEDEAENAIVWPNEVLPFVANG